MDSKRTTLKIERLPRGGYVVTVPATDYNRCSEQLFACADIDDALAFIEDELGEPEEAEGDGSYSSAMSLVAQQQAANGKRAKEFSEAELQILLDASKETSDALGLVFDADKVEAGIKSLRDNARNGRCAGKCETTEPTFEDGIKARKYGGII